jgi:hypothetical protein
LEAGIVEIRLVEMIDETSEPVGKATEINDWAQRKTHHRVVEKLMAKRINLYCPTTIHFMITPDTTGLCKKTQKRTRVITTVVLLEFLHPQGNSLLGKNTGGTRRLENFNFAGQHDDSK